VRCCFAADGAVLGSLSEERVDEYIYRRESWKWKMGKNQ